MKNRTKWLAYSDLAWTEHIIAPPDEYTDALSTKERLGHYLRQRRIVVTIPLSIWVSTPAFAAMNYSLCSGMT